MDIFLKIGQIWGGDNTIFEFLARFWGGTTDFSPQIWGEATSYYSPKNQVWGGCSPTDPKMGGVSIWRPKAADLKPPRDVFGTFPKVSASRLFVPNWCSSTTQVQEDKQICYEGILQTFLILLIYHILF